MTKVFRDLAICGILYCGFTSIAKKWWFDNDFKDVFPDVFEPYRNRYDDAYCLDSETFEESLKRLFRIEPSTEDFIAKRKNKQIFEKNPANKRINLPFNNNLNGRKNEPTNRPL